MSSRRVPVIVILVALLVGAAVVDRDDPDVEPAAPTLTASAQRMPVAPPPSALSSTWYCAGGTASDDGGADHTVVVANPSDREVVGTLTAYPSEGDVGARELDLEPWSRVEVRLADLVSAPHAAALVEMAGGGVVVEHQVEGEHGHGAGACAAAASGTWYLAAGATTADATEVLALFNPFPDDAIVDITFSTDDGFRAPQDYEGFVVPGGRVVPVDITPVVTRRAQVATSVVARSGRLVVDRVQTFDGSEGVEGLSVNLAAPEPGDTWYFPEGFVGDGISERYFVYNPGGAPAEVDLDVQLDDPDTNGEIEPFALTVPPEGYVAVVAGEEQRIPPGVAHSATVRSLNGVPVVAERVVVAGEPSTRAGVAMTVGSPLEATRWVFPAGGAAEDLDEWIVVQNPSSASAVEVSVTALVRGQRLAVQGLQGREVDPAGRLAVRLGDHVERDDLPLLVEATAPVVVERGLYQIGQRGISVALGIPLAEGVRVPQPHAP